jgi:iron(III) transport system permease protein
MTDQTSALPVVIRRPGGFLLLLILCVLVFSVLPFARLVIIAVAPGWTWNPSAAFAAVASRSAMLATWNGIETAVTSAFGALFIGLAFALALALTDVRGKRVLAFLFVLSLLIAPQVAALAYKTLAGPASPLLNALGLAPPPGTPNPMLGRGGIILVLALHHAPLAAITLATGLRSIPASLIAAAQVDGGSPARITREIVLPLLRPQIAAAWLIVFVAAIGNFGIPALLGLPVNYTTLPTLIYRQFTSFGPSALADAAALSVLVAFLAGAGVVAAAFVLDHAPARREIELPMQAFWRLGRWRPLAETALWLLLAVGCALPFASLLATSLVPSYGMALSFQTITSAKFLEVLVHQDMTARALRNSLTFAALAASATAVLSVVLAYTLDRKAGKWRRPFEVLIEIPYALPGIALAIACILLFLKPLPVIGVSIYGTPFIILFAYLARFLPLALKAPLAAMSTLAHDQEEAAALDGANAWQRLCKIVLPSLLPAATAGALLVFLIAFNELTVSALLWSAGTETLGVALLSLEEAGFAGEAAAIGVTATLLVAAIMLVLDRFSGSLPEDVLPWIALAPDSKKTTDH